METSVGASQRKRDIELVCDHRRLRILAVEQFASGLIEKVLGEDNLMFGHVYVVKLLDVVPGIGKVAGRRLLSSVGLNGFSTVSHMTAQQRLCIIEAIRALP